MDSRQNGGAVMKRRRVYGRLAMPDGTHIDITDRRVAAYIEALVTECARLRTELEQREQRPPLVVVPH